jgi:hypothetical protein
MGPVSKWDSPVFTEAFLVWTAYGQDMMPRHDDASVVSRFGAEAASELLPAIRSLMDEFYLSDAKYTAADLVEMGEMATQEFKAKHPEVADEVLKALAWCYTFDFR